MSVIIARFAKDAGTQREFLGKENRVGDSLGEMNYGDFCVISGDNMGFESIDREYDGEIETVEDKLDRMNPGMNFDVKINKDADITELEEDEIQKYLSFKR
ncbi:MAG: hypothetical protein H8Z69_06075 [Nanohaloarchaea archaeon]|nr:hypothetical protein [Candidatus Nanohaloarchaea archaeon]